MQPTLLSVQGILSSCLQARGSTRSGWQWRLQAHYEKKWVGFGYRGEHVNRNGVFVNYKARILSLTTARLSMGWIPHSMSLSGPLTRKIHFCLFVGTVSVGKGVDVLAEALESLPERGWRCVIAGSGPLLAELQSRGIEGLEFLGSIEWQQLQSYLCRAWALVHPTLADTSPNAVKEARVVGLPVITSKHGGHTDYIIDHVNGRIVDPLNAKELGAVCHEMMEDLDLVKSMGANRHAEDREYLRPENTASSFVKIYKELLGNAQ